jgi:hypothetical protein
MLTLPPPPLAMAKHAAALLHQWALAGGGDAATALLAEEAVRHFIRQRVPTMMALTPARTAKWKHTIKVAVAASTQIMWENMLENSAACLARTLKLNNVDDRPCLVDAVCYGLPDENATIVIFRMDA